MKNYDLSEQDIQEIADRAATNALTKAGLIKPQISTNEANKRYGRTRINQWRKRGLIIPVKQGNIIYWKVAELEKAASRNIL